MFKVQEGRTSLAWKSNVRHEGRGSITLDDVIQHNPNVTKCPKAGTALASIRINVPCYGFTIL